MPDNLEIRSEGEFYFCEGVSLEIVKFNTK